MRKQASLQYCALLLAAALLAAPLATVVFAAVPMRASRRSFGRAWFWGGHLAMAGALAAAGALPAAVAIVLLTALIGSYAEIEDHGSSVFASATFAVVATLGAALIGVAAVIAKTKGSIVAQLRAEFAEVARQVSDYNPKIEMNADAMLYRTPSFLALLLILSLAAALVWENRALALARLPTREGLRDRLTNYRVPDVFVWAAMAAILGSFGLNGRLPVAENASINILIVLAALYFFQGLAVVAKAFDAFTVATFWRGFWYVMIIIQLYPLVSALGFADYWVDFRAKLPKGRPFETNKSV